MLHVTYKEPAQQHFSLFKVFTILGYNTNEQENRCIKKVALICNIPYSLQLLTFEKYQC